EKSAKNLIHSSVKFVTEDTNMRCTSETIDLLIENNILFGPAQAVNAGGVAASALERAQNSARLAWTAEELDDELKSIMKRIYRRCNKAAQKYAEPNNLVVGSNIVGYTNIADTMIDLGYI